ncbi:LVIVD repeat-containing protein [Nocardioides perillae]|uniref:LVIVD repeat-containing protein n=1 Tax=Nocardioides perillae TaxID=1119534 RepID=A0A7Y9RVB8_9ACTN|nr:hypothetical protein [Nocardioides perillae]NYG54605.1 hypothetical protein [Nocardioides perillae]
MSRDPSALSLRTRTRSAVRRPLAAAGLALAVAAALVPATATAHDGSHSSQEEATSAQAPQNCPPGLAKQLARGAGDRFGAGCDIAGGDLGAMDDSGTQLAEGETASSDNLSLLANRPKSGAFAAETAYNSDLAFSGDHAFAGNYNGFTVWDISAPAEPQEVAQVVCLGSQNDISVYGDVLVLSVDSSRASSSCEAGSQSSLVKSSWEGLRVFDVSDPANPEYVAAVETDCGSHTHTLAPTKDGQTLYAYASSYSPNVNAPDCQPPHDKISVVEIPLDDPSQAALVSEPVLFPEGGNPGGNGSSTTSGCHDITAYPSKDIAAGACMGDGVILDISDRENPVVTETVRDTENFAFWHSATFNNEGTKVVFTDELGGGGAATCNPTVGPDKGADAIYRLQGGQLEFASYYKIPRTNSNTENCVAHNGSLIPVKGRDIMVQAWYQGGISVFDFTNAKRPREIAWFDRGPISDERLVLGGSWSAYWYRGHIYSNDIQQGFDVLTLDDKIVKTAAKSEFDEFNPQSQPSWNG